MSDPRNTRTMPEMTTPETALELTAKRDTFILHTVINPAAQSELMTLTATEMEAVMLHANYRQNGQPAVSTHLKAIKAGIREQRLHDQAAKVAAVNEALTQPYPNFADILEVQPIGEPLLADLELEQAERLGTLLKEGALIARDRAYHTIRNSKALQDGADAYYLTLRNSAPDKDKVTVNEATALLMAMSSGLEVLAQLARTLGDAREEAVKRAVKRLRGCAVLPQAEWPAERPTAARIEIELESSRQAREDAERIAEAANQAAWDKKVRQAQGRFEPDEVIPTVPQGNDVERQDTIAE